MLELEYELYKWNQTKEALLREGTCPKAEVKAIDVLIKRVAKSLITNPRGTIMEEKQMTFNNNQRRTL